MADTWSWAANVFTLTLDGSGTGQESRSQVFGVADGLVADTLYTWYFVVNPSVAEVEAFIEVDGGDRTTATVTGSQTLLVRGTTDGSGNITLRFGVAQAGNAPGTLFFEDDLDYADVTALAAGGWTLVESGGGTVSIDTTDLDGNTTGVVKGSVINSGNAYIKRTLTTVIGRTYTARCRGRNGATIGFDTGSRLEWNPGSNVSTHIATWADMSVAKTATGTSLEIHLGRKGGYFGIPGTYAGKFHGLTIDDGVGGASATVTFARPTFCEGTGTTQTPGQTGNGGGTGGGGGGGTGTEPPPVEPPGGYPPPPVGGARPFGVYGISTGGLGYWNSTVKVLKGAYAVNQINTSVDNNMMNMFVFGNTQDWLTGGRFDYAKWKAIVDGIANNATTNALLEAAITSGNAWCHHIIDEPYHLTRYGGPIPLATVERMCLYSKSIWPTWPTMVRVAPIFPWITRKIAGCNYLWAEYLSARGDCLTYRDANLARTAALGFDGCIMGLHYMHFTAAETGRDITPSEIEHYGKILASGTPSLVPAFSGWRYDTNWYSVPGAVEAVRRLRDYFASLDP